MHKRALSMLAAACLAMPLMAQVASLEGFYYGSMQAPTGWEWQSVDSLSLNKEQPHAWHEFRPDGRLQRRVHS